MLNLYKETTEIMKKYGITANKNLGQNFLIDEEALNSIIDCSDITENDLVIEIGPGLGTLTSRLLEKAGRVVIIELDERMVNLLSKRFSGENKLTIISNDVLKIDLKDVIEKNRLKGKVKVVANLPYYITTPIIMKLLEEKLDLTSITIMIQKEVADRIVASPGDKLCGAITSAIRYYSNPEFIKIVPSDSFLPSPKVDSAVVKLNILEKPIVQVKNEDMFFKIIKIAFSQRRKTFLNSIVNNQLMSRQDALEMLKYLGVSENRRGETFSLEEFANIENYITQKNI